MMKYFLAAVSLLLIFASAKSQVVISSPVFPRADEPVTITVDVTGTSLDQFAWDNTTNPVYIWTWIAEGCTSNCDAPANVNPATSPNQDAAKMTRISTDPDVYEITFTPTIFFNKSINELVKIGLKLKSRDWNDNKQTDNNKFIAFNNTGNFLVGFTQPTAFPIFKNQGDQVSITAAASEVSSLTLKINNTIVAQDAANTSLSYTHTIIEGAGESTVLFEANNGNETKSAQFTYVVRSSTTNQARPAGIIEGINYSSDHTKVTLCLIAPGKTSVYVLGDFSDWSVSPQYQMKKDGEYFWTEITDLTPGEEYAFKYLVDESIYIADPYADKILDPDDQYIPATSYPDLKPYPSEALTDKSYFNRVSVFQTNQTPYTWQVTNFQKPAKDKLVVYELLVRDFFGTGERNYQNLIDTLSYFKRLGINAIQLMPIMEFNGNESWGYNPTFMFAPDKYYGTKNKLKEFIDKCHQNGIAVILDIALNQQDTPNPYALMDFDFVAFRPNATNKWFFPTGRHPANVFFDMNHGSTYTQQYVDTINHYWLNEFKVDGFRFDLSKGFSTTNYCTTSNCDTDDEYNAWGAYDATRVSILKRMADEIWSHTSDAIVILEHFGGNQEEKELAEYRANENMGMMLWGKMTDPYNQNTMGYASNSDISWVYHGTRGWSTPHVIGFMESHDEERLMYSNLQSGNVSGNYNVKDLSTALNRMKGAFLMFIPIPGPKMIWEFGELGYDFSINRCENGSISNDCRLSIKPARWDYQDVAARASLYDHVSDLLNLRENFDVFTEGDVVFSGNSSLQKQLTLKNKPYTATPATTNDMNIQIVVNFDVVPRIVSVAFPHTGKWFDYFNDNSEQSVSGTPYSISLQPGQFKLYSDVKISFDDPITESESDIYANINIYPNPATNLLKVTSEKEIIESISIKTIDGRSILIEKNSEDTWDVSTLPVGIYIVKVIVRNRPLYYKLIKQ